MIFFMLYLYLLAAAGEAALRRLENERRTSALVRTRRMERERRVASEEAAAASRLQEIQDAAAARRQEYEDAGVVLQNAFNAFDTIIDSNVDREHATIVLEDASNVFDRLNGSDMTVELRSNNRSLAASIAEGGRNNEVRVVPTVQNTSTVVNGTDTAQVVGSGNRRPAVDVANNQVPAVPIVDNTSTVVSQGRSNRRINWADIEEEVISIADDDDDDHVDEHHSSDAVSS